MRTWCLAVASAVLLSSCSVKEERSSCPCLLNLDLDEVIRDGRYARAVTTIGEYRGGHLEQELILIESYKDVGYEISVPRLTVNASVVCGCGRERFSNESVYAGTAPLMAFTADVHCQSDKEIVNVILHKQYAKLSVKPEGYSSVADYPFKMRINAATGSLGLYRLEPCGDPFTELLDEDLSLNLPRQSPGAALTLDVMDEDSEILFTVDLSAKLKSAGYDWEAEDLADVAVKLDFVRMTGNVTVLPWEESSEYTQIDI